MTIEINIKTIISQIKNTKEYFKFIKEHFCSIDKSLAGISIV